MDKLLGKFLALFEQISSIPRCSGNEAAIGKWLCNWAKDHELKYRQDNQGNTLIEVPASEGYEDSPKLVLQGHTDMVCEKGSGSSHDFEKDAIKLIVEGDWLRADNTTLGADNGVALAMSLMVVEEKIPHPALELLFTVDEETGLTGANSLQSDFVSGSLLINLDSESEGKFTIGCAGGKKVEMYLEIENDLAADNSLFVKLSLSGLMGGHSGVDIKKNRGCAIKLLSRALYELKKEFSFNLAGFKGGSAHNAIAREASCILSIYPDDLLQMKEKVKILYREYQREYRENEKNLKFEIEETGKLNEILSEESTLQVIDFLLAVPHGVSAMSATIPDLVETSCNLAVARLEEKQLNIMISIRSSVETRLRGLSNRIASISELAGARFKSNEGYPAWEPDPESKLLKRSIQTYKALFQQEPEVLVIHAGLECGVLGKVYPEMDMISIGPTIENPHSPQERLNLPSFKRTWDFLASLLKGFR